LGIGATGIMATDSNIDMFAVIPIFKLSVRISFSPAYLPMKQRIGKESVVIRMV
jgi:hypothetical protein